MISPAHNSARSLPSELRATATNGGGFLSGKTSLQNFDEGVEFGTDRGCRGRSRGHIGNSRAKEMKQALLNADFLLDRKRIKDRDEGESIRQRKRISHLISL